MKEKQPNRLRELLQMEKLSKEEFADIHHISGETLKAYINGARAIPVQFAIKPVKTYGISLDWLYGQTEFISDLDRAFCVLRKLLRIEPKQQKVVMDGTLYFRPEINLYSHEQLFNFLCAMQELKNLKEIGHIEEKEYEEEFRLILGKYTEELKDIIGQPNFAEGKQILIDNLEISYPADKDNQT